MTAPYPHPVSSWLDPDTGALIPHDELMAEMAQNRVVLLGETHDQYDVHRWQLHVMAALHGRNPNMVVGFEMFPRSTQPILDEWAAGDLSEEAFLEKVDWKTVWGFPPEMYLPIFRFCREMGVHMIALNCYRALVTRVGKEGWDAIPEEDRDELTPAKPATDAYRDYLFSLVSGPDGIFQQQTEEAKARKDHFTRAQQTWDRAFACNIAKTQTGDNPPLVIGIIGRGHLEFGHGTPYQLDDLGIEKVSVLLPSGGESGAREQQPGIARACFRLPKVHGTPANHATATDRFVREDRIRS
ncbi:ChaN family lipoprotein [uncultured Sneathiella sp.]|uniref:ChaN family lipoprotein n=1 Tax=uncultured Sneathiella sp. TaxID=879315 RepID=UPI0030EDA118|tara:strand:- start:36460 stop:37353 length:894 start_codon:yes stop_codon:yes gene_type:complete